MSFLFFKTIEPFHLLPDHVLDAIATNTDIVYWGKGESVSLVMPEGKKFIYYSSWSYRTEIS